MNIFETISDIISKVGAWFFSWFGDDPRVEQIRERVADTCQFLPSAASVAAMLAAANPTVSGVVGIATAICNAVTAARQRRIAAHTLIGETGTIGTVNGVDIDGDDLKGS